MGGIWVFIGMGWDAQGGCGGTMTEFWGIWGIWGYNSGSLGYNSRIWGQYRGWFGVHWRIWGRYGGTVGE